MKRHAALVLALSVATSAAGAGPHDTVEPPAQSGSAAAANLANGANSMATGKEAAAAPVVRLTRWTVDGGGGLVGGSGWELRATVGQPEPGFATGGGYRLHSGFWFAANGGHLFSDGFE